MRGIDRGSMEAYKHLDNTHRHTDTSNITYVNLTIVGLSQHQYYIYQTLILLQLLYSYSLYSSMLSIYITTLFYRE